MEKFALTPVDNFEFPIQRRLWEEAGEPDTERTCRAHTMIPGLHLEIRSYLKW